MKRNTSWSALLIGIFVTMIVIIIAIYLLDKIIPFSKDIKWVESGNISYYRANTALNEALLSMSVSDPAIEAATGSISNGSGFTYNIRAMSRVLPEAGKWNSDFNKDWAVLAPGKPIQLALKSTNPIDWGNAGTYFNFRVPDLNNDNTVNEFLTWGAAAPIINWVITASGESLQASGSQIMASDINGTPISLETRPGLTLSGTNVSFKDFYWPPGNMCTGSNVCSLKLSLINPLLLTTGEKAPYLEYQAHLNEAIPLQTAVIETEGYMGGFKKNITRFIQQMTTSEALDFTVFQ